MPIFTETRNTVRLQVGRNTGRLMQPGTLSVTVGSPNSVRLEDLFLRDADLGRGLYLYIPSGGGAGQARTVISATAGVQGTGSILYPHLNFSPAPSTDAVVELWKGVDPRVVNGFIDDAIRAAAKKYLEHKEDYSIQLGDPLRHWGSFERWPDGSSSPPDGWNEDSGAGSVARESTIKYSGRYSLQQTNTASNPYILETDDIPNFPAYAGKVLTVKAKVQATTASRVRVNITDGTATQSSSFHGGTGGWDGEPTTQETLSVSITVASNPSELRVQLEIATGGAISAYWGKVWVEGADMIYEFELPAPVAPATSDETGFASISEIWAESLDHDGVFTVRIPPEFYFIDAQSSTRRLLFRKDVIDQYVRSGRQLRIVGQRPARLPQADAQNIEVDPEYVKLAAAYRVLDANPWNEEDRAKRDRWAAEARQMLQEITTPIYPDSVLVE